nr:response regulator [Terrimicrobiaceae bacterium]
MSTPELRAAIIDDEAPAREVLRDLLTAHPNVRVIGEADSVANAVTLCRDLNPNLLFLDVQMEDGEGFDVLPQISSLPAIIFVT